MVKSLATLGPQKKIAFVFEAFSRAGAQRNALEILKGIKLFAPHIKTSLYIIAPKSSLESPSFLEDVALEGISLFIMPYNYKRDESGRVWSRFLNYFSRHLWEYSHNRAFYDRLQDCSAVVCFQPYVVDLLLPHLWASTSLCFHLGEHRAQRNALSDHRLINHILMNSRVSIVFQHISQVFQLSSQCSPENSIVWPLRLCPDHFSDTSSLGRNLGCRSDQVLRISHYSRISPMRFIEKIIDAFSLLCQIKVSHLRIAGSIEDPVYYEKLLAQIDELGISSAVSFVAPVPVPAEDPARDQIDLVWMISLSGHIGYAGIESMAAGLPTLLLEVDHYASATPSDPELVDAISNTAQHLVERSLAVYADLDNFRNQQSHLVRQRFMTTKQAIDELTAFYLAPQ